MTRGYRARGTLIVSVLFPVLAALAVSSCKAPPEFRPDSVLQAELGLTDRDEVHRILLTGGETEVATPAEVTIEEGAWIEFLTDDWLVHEVVFLVDAMSAEARTFLEETDQAASPPLLRKGARFVLDFSGAPPGSYPYSLDGSSGAGAGVVVVTERR